MTKPITTLTREQIVVMRGAMEQRYDADERWKYLQFTIVCDMALKYLDLMTEEELKKRYPPLEVKNDCIA